MIIEGLFQVIAGLFKLVINLIPSMESIVIPTDIFNTFDYLFEMSAYFIPFQDIFLMISIWVVVVNFHFIYSVIMRLWDALPFT